MCLRSRQIVNPSRWLRPESGQPLFLDIPCGSCSECIIQYRNEWRNRAYFEALDVFSRSDKAFILFATLTYRDGCLPHLSDLFDVPHDVDFACFSKRDCQLFFKRLRMDLGRDGFDVKDNLRFFLTSEYGSHNTLRPHYHILFFSCVPNLDNITLSRYISAAWCYYDVDGNRQSIGITDCVPYKSTVYVHQNTLYSSDIYRVSTYVSKYVTKDFSYSKLVSDRLSQLDDKYLDYDNIEAIKRLVRPFHLQSKGFGWSYVKNTFPLDYFFQFGSLPVLARNGVTQHVSLPMSLKRKIFYSYSRDKKNGRVTWIASDDYKKFVVNCSRRNIAHMADRIFSKQFKYDDAYKLAEYVLFARNRLISKYTSPENSIINSFNINDGFRNYCAVDRKFINTPVMTKLDFGSKLEGFVSDITLQKCLNIHDIGDLEYVDLVTFKNFMYNSDLECLYQKYKGLSDLKADGQLDLLKLQHRLRRIHKSKTL